MLGTVLANPTTGDLEEFDNDQFFSIRLMPQPPLPATATDAQETDFTADVVSDGSQGEEVLAPVPPPWDLPYAAATEEERYALHCDAEGNFWQPKRLRRADGHRGRCRRRGGCGICGGVNRISFRSR